MQQALLRSGLSCITLRILTHRNHDAAERRRKLWKHDARAYDAILGNEHSWLLSMLLREWEHNTNKYCSLMSPPSFHSHFHSEFHIVRSIASFFNYQYSLVSLKPSSSCLHVLRLSITSILLSMFPVIWNCWRQLLCKVCPIQLHSLLFIVCRIFLFSLILCSMCVFVFNTTGPTDILHPSPAPHFKALQVWSTFWIVQVSAPHTASLQM